MRPLSGLDTLFLHTDSVRYPMHGLGLMVLEPSTAPEPITYDGLKRHFRARLPHLPPMRRRLARVPLGIERPAWVEDPEFDLDEHFHHVAVPAPGEDRELAALVADIGNRPLDDTRPLWEYWFVEGLAGGRVAVVLKMHHACIDGMGGIEMVQHLFDLEPAPERDEPEDTWEPEAVPSPERMFLRALPAAAWWPVRATRSSVNLAKGLVRGRRARARSSSHAGKAFSGPEVSFSRRISGRPHKNFAWASVSMDDVKTVRAAFDAKVNDVVLALCAGSLHRYLEERGELPDEPLTVANPINLRETDESGAYENKVAMMAPRLPAQLADPAERIRAVVASTTDTKAASRASGTNLLEDLFGVVSPGMVDVAMQVYTTSGIAGLLPAPYNLCVTNLIGPPIPLYFAGARLEGFYIQMPLLDRIGLVIALLSYAGRLQFGITGTGELTPDVWSIARGIEGEMGLLLEAASGARSAAVASRSPRS